MYADGVEAAVRKNVRKNKKRRPRRKSKKKANASSKGVDLLELAAFVEGDDEDAQLTDDEQKPPAKGRFRQPSVCQMEEELLEKTDFIYRKIRVILL